jgi:hypothetical protein
MATRLRYTVETPRSVWLGCDLVGGLAGWSGFYTRLSCWPRESPSYGLERIWGAKCWKKAVIATSYPRHLTPLPRVTDNT